MKILKIGGIVVAALILLFVVVGLFLPDEFAISRSVVVEAPAAAVFDQVNNLDKRLQWDPWKAADSTMTVKVSDPAVGVGAWYSWESEHSGAGKMTITESTSPTSIKTELIFDAEHGGTGWWTFKETVGGIEATWGMNGEASGLAHRYMGLLMESFVGPSFEEGLATMKKLAEKAPAPEAPPAPQ